MKLTKNLILITSGSEALKGIVSPLLRTCTSPPLLVATTWGFSFVAWQQGRESSESGGDKGGVAKQEMSSGDFV